MSRRHAARDRWVIPLSDLLLLLLGVFAVLYAASTVDASKYRVTARSLAAAFDSNPSEFDKEQRRLDALQRNLRRSLAPMIDRKQVGVRRVGRVIEVEIRNDVLFASGSAELADSARTVLGDLAQPLAASPGAIRVEGHTDDVPITGSRYPSNWELSAARAAAVVRLFVDRGIDPRRLSVAGHAEFRPAGSNSTAAGRETNRRVLLAIRAE